jgi:hypothetical protein
VHDFFPANITSARLFFPWVRRKWVNTARLTAQVIDLDQAILFGV